MYELFLNMLCVVQELNTKCVDDMCLVLHGCMKKYKPLTFYYSAIMGNILLKSLVLSVVIIIILYFSYGILKYLKFSFCTLIFAHLYLLNCLEDITEKKVNYRFVLKPRKV